MHGFPWFSEMVISEPQRHRASKSLLQPFLSVGLTVTAICGGLASASICRLYTLLQSHPTSPRFQEHHGHIYLDFP